DRATSWPSSTRARPARWTRPRRPAWSGRCGTPGTRARSRTSTADRRRADAAESQVTAMPSARPVRRRRRWARPDTRPPRRRRAAGRDGGAREPSPALEEAAVEPVPEQVHHQPRTAIPALIHGHAHAAVQHDVLPPVQRDLHLRHEIPAGCGAPFELARGEHLEHRRPRAAEPPLGERASAGDTPERLPAGDGGVGRQLEARLRLDERVAREDLSERHERFEDRHAASETLGLLAGRQDDLAGDAENVPARDVVVERVLHGEGDVAETPSPAAGRALLELYRHGKLE